MEDFPHYDTQIELILQRIIDPSFGNRFGPHLEQFGHLLESLETDAGENSIFNKLPIFSNWITKAVLIWSKTKSAPSPNVIIFILDLARLLSQKEDGFCLLNTNNFFIKLINISKAKNPESGIPVKHGFVKLLRIFLQHKSGIEWMLASRFWENVLQLALREKDEDLSKSCNNLLAKLLEETIEVDQDFAIGVMKRIAQLLRDNVCSVLEEFSEMSVVSNYGSIYKLNQNITSIGSILEYFLKRIKSSNSFKASIFFLNTIQIEKSFLDLNLITNSKEIRFQVTKIQFYSKFLELFVGVQKNKFDENTLLFETKKLMDNFWSNTYQEDLEDVLKICRFGHFYWNLIQTHISVKETKTTNVENYGNQIMFVELIPYYGIMMEFCPHLEELLESESEEVHDFYIQKLLKSFFSPDCIRTFYFWRDNLPKDLLILTQLTVDSLKNLKKSLKYFSRNQIIILVEELTYTLKDTITISKQAPNLLNLIPHQSDLFGTMFDLLHELIERFNITWKDGFVTIDILDLCFEYLTFSPWPKTVIFYILKMINISIVKRMTASLALFVDRTEDSALVALGPDLSEKLQDSDSGIRKITVEIVHTLAQISSTEFTSLQKVLLDSHLPALIVQIMTSDLDKSIQTAAVSCLKEMILIDSLWDKTLFTLNIPKKIMVILSQETNQFMKIETIKLLINAYNSGRVTKIHLCKIFKIMCHISTSDPNWRVRVESLTFWGLVIKKYLQNKGMIDGSFPEVTFSKEQKKIITLTESEIRNRLLIVLEELNAIGCLGLLLKIIIFDCDADVTRAAAKIVENLQKLFETYKLSDFKSIAVKKRFRKNGILHISSEDFLHFSAQSYTELIAKKEALLKQNEDFIRFLDSFSKTLQLETNGTH